MRRKQAEQRIAKLRDLIHDYRYHYHVLNKSIMSEAAADSLKHELSQLEEQHPELITPDSPTQRVAGSPLPGFKTISHSRPMLSLNDVFDEAELRAWHARILKLLPEGLKPDFFTDIKMDGLACALVYQDGKLTQAITRGDGITGEDVTANVRTMESVPLILRNSPQQARLLSGRTEVRGEIVMYKTDFEQLNKQRADKGLPLFANPRNTAAGTIRQLDPRLVAERRLYYRAYDLLRDDPEEVPTNLFAYKSLSSIGMLVNAQAAKFSEISDVLKFAEKWDTKRRGLPFNTDGLVIKVNDRIIFERLGVVGKAPRGAVAYKYAAEQATTKIRDIFVSISRTGSATPVAMLEPVVIAGSTVQMATLHNEGEVKRKDIRVGDTVIVHKAGDIIPEVIEPLTALRDGSEKLFKMPDSCPECGTKLVKLKANEAVWRCPNNQCPSRVWKRIQHYASKTALDIESLGEKNVIALLNSGLIKDTPDIYALDKEQLLNLERFADISASKLVAAIQSKKNPPLHRFIYGLGLRHVGVQTAIDLSNRFKSLEAIGSATIDELCQVEGIGLVVAESVAEWFGDPENQRILALFKNYGVRPENVKEIGGPLSGKRFVVTGSLDSMSREQAAEKIRALGGIFQSSVGKDTDYLVVGGNVGASKLTKAAKFGTKQISEDKFISLLQNKH